MCVCVGGGGVLIMAMATDACWGGHFVSNHAFCCRTGFLWRTSVIIVCHASGCTEMGLGLNQFYRSVIFAVCRITEALITRIWRWYLTSFATAKWWRHQMESFPRYWRFVRGIRRSSANSPHKGQWQILMFSLICARINGWVNSREAGNLRRHHAHYDIIVVKLGRGHKSNINVIERSSSHWRRN